MEHTWLCVFFILSISIGCPSDLLWEFVTIRYYDISTMFIVFCLTRISRTRTVIWFFQKFELKSFSEVKYLLCKNIFSGPLEIWVGDDYGATPQTAIAKLVLQETILGFCSCFLNVQWDQFFLKHVFFYMVSFPCFWVTIWIKHVKSLERQCCFPN